MLLLEINQPGTRYQPANAEELAKQLQAADEGWTYRAIHVPNGKGWSYIAIYDEDGVKIGEWHE